MKANLAFIDTVANAAISRETQTPTVSAAARDRVAKAGMRIIAGLAVNDEMAVNSALDRALRERRDAADEYRHDRDRVIDKLGELGIKPLAVLPKTAWERICSASGLFRLSPDRNGKVPISDSVVKKVEKLASHTGLVGVIILCMLGGVALGMLTPGGVPGGFVGAIALFFLAIVIFTMNNGALGNRFDEVVAKMYFGCHAMKPWKRQLRDLLTDGPDLEESELRARVILPSPPAETAAVLLKARMLNLKVAAVADAIGFAEMPGSMFAREYNRRLKTDPIVYHEHGTAVAIIAQFGDFPIEERVVNEVVNSEHLI